MSDQPGLRLVPLVSKKPGKIQLDGVVMPTISAALAAAEPGSVVMVGRGRYAAPAETFPLRVPAGVTLRGPEPRKLSDEAKKFLPTPPPAQIVASESAIELVGDGATVAHVTIRSHRPGVAATLTVGAVRDVVVDTCEISGRVAITGARQARIVWTTVERGRVTVDDVDGFTLTGGAITGTHASGALLRLAGCTDVKIEAAAITGAETAVSILGCTDVLIGGCALLADTTAVGATNSNGIRVNGNRLRANRAVHLVGCDDGEIAANGVEEADVAIALEGCRDVTIGRNHVAQARVEVVETP